MSSSELPSVAGQARPSRRKGNKKVRTGCLTCKVRKVKCDEAKPHCNRCITTGRICDGYVAVPMRRGDNSSSEGRLPQQVLASVPGLATAGERRMFAYYTSRCAPSLCGVVATDFWSRIIPNLALSEPSVRHSVLAIGSLHEYITTRADSPSDKKRANWQFAIHQFVSAVREVRTWRPAETPVVPLIVCILFVCVELLTAHEAACQLHIGQGRKILHELQDEPGTPSPTRALIKTEVVPIFTRLSLASFLFGRHPASIPSHLKVFPSRSGEFSSVEEAKNVLYQTLDEAFYFSAAARAAVYSPDHNPDTMDTLKTTQTDLLSRLAQWQTAFAILMAKPSKTSRRKLYLEENMLLMYYHAAFIWSSSALQHSETSFDAYMPSFSSIVMHAAKIINILSEGGRTSPFVFESEVIPPLYWVAVKCRHPLLRREALKLLLRDEVKARREQLWPAEQTALLATRIIEVEEQLENPSRARNSDHERPQRPRKGQRRLSESAVQIHASEYPLPENILPESRVEENADISFMSHATDLDGQVDADAISLSPATTSSPSTASEGASPPPKPLETVIPVWAHADLKSPFGIPEQQRIKNAVIGPDEVGGTWLTLFLDPEPGQTHWRVIREFVAV